MRIKLCELGIGQVFRFVDSTVDYVVTDDSSPNFIYALCIYNGARRCIPKYLRVEIAPYDEIQLSLF